MKMKKTKRRQSDEDVEPLSLEEKRELKRRIDDLDDPVRYVVFSDIGGNGRWRLWLDVSRFHQENSRKRGEMVASSCEYCGVPESACDRFF